MLSTSQTLARAELRPSGLTEHRPEIHILSVKSTYTVSQAQSSLPRLLREAEKGGAVRIRRHAETVAYILSRARMEALVETLEILDNPAAMRAIREHRSGKTKFFPLKALDHDLS
jgi:prevent-host-death family protein